ncbi:DUF262 domain-containing protein [Pseudomonas alloputida]|uniref:DUF262 domain-containing protein n=1 Tax=Pseudomonas TaxID=286 RepID=UPI003EEFC21A
MKLESKDPIIRTIISQVEENEIDLEPDFQRGEVWNTAKKQMLIDTILRNWQMPPVFVVSSENGLDKAVLDGHQRLTSVMDFYNNKYKIDGLIQPSSTEIESLHNLYYKDLPEQVKKRFQNYSIRMFDITDYNESEPFELFFRLNQSVKLTSAERRNTFYGKVREQVKKLVLLMEDLNYSRDTIGFSNTRLSYHDVIVRVMLALETKSLSRKMTDAEITDRYRSHISFSHDIESRIATSLELLINAIHRTGKLKLSKPSLFSIIEFISEHSHSFTHVEVEAFLNKYKSALSLREQILSTSSVLDAWLLKEYTYRLSTSVNDSKSLIIRRFFLYYTAFNAQVLPGTMNKDIHETISELSYKLSELQTDEAYDILINNHWGSIA